MRYFYDVPIVLLICRNLFAVVIVPLFVLEAPKPSMLVAFRDCFYRVECIFSVGYESLAVNRIVAVV